MTLTKRENFLRTVEFRNPEWIPVSVNLPNAVWKKYGEELENIVLRHPILFEGYRKGSKNFSEYPLSCRKGYHRDNWGCLWYNVAGGMLGQVVEHPLSDWRFLDTYKLPDPFKKTDFEEQDWDEIKKSTREQKKKGLLTQGSGGELFTRLYYLRGFENLMMDIATDDPHLLRLIEMLTNYELKLVNKWLKIGVDVIYFHTDIGTQNGLMISPAKFRNYIKPMFKKIFIPCRKAGTHIFLSSDGNLLEIIDDLIECGVSIHDPQIRANTLEGIARTYKGKKICVKVDLDEQMFAFCKPTDIRRQIKEVAEKLYSPQGGLMIYGDPSPDVPLENIEAICSALEEFYTYKGEIVHETCL